ncbi:pyridoxamine 5'-phosphate oxidase family protein [Dongia sp.]|uniref:pyridoxamine 5'-phosphate oxidase family protein n=1 Tax=Dongia sp. TaxID=1977262 RepID=UPI0035B0E574
MNEPIDPKREIIRLMQLPKAAFGTLASRESGNYPSVSLVVPALDDTGMPLLLLSDLSDHVRNLGNSPRASLLFDGTGGIEEPLTGPRVTLLGEVSVTADAQHRTQYLAARPETAFYADFKDFRFYRFSAVEALLVAGFGRIHRLSAAELWPQA